MPPTWDTCKKCGAPLLVSVTAAPAAANGSGPVPIPRRDPATPTTPTAARPDATATFVAESDLLPRPASPRSTPAPARPPRSRAAGPRVHGRHVAILAAAIAVGAALLAWWPSGGEDGSSTAGGVEILAPLDETEVPGVESAFRVEAEAAARQAMVIVSQVYAQTAEPSAVTPELVASFDPASSFVEGGIASTSTAVVSMRADSGGAVIATAGTGDICAFGRIGSDLVVSYVTAKTPTCRAIDAPATGWSGPQSGGGVGNTDGALIFDT